MPEQFVFESENELVTAGLTAAEIAGVARWQSLVLDYKFEFHTMHEAGWPCYLREPNGPRRNLSKINLKEGAYDGTILQGETVVDNKCGEDFKAVVKANVGAFRTLGERFYEGVDDAPVIPPTAWYVRFYCSQKGKVEPFYIRMPERAQAFDPVFWSNKKDRAEWPKCPLHRNAKCSRPRWSNSALTTARTSPRPTTIPSASNGRATASDRFDPGSQRGISAQ